jgi:hypothetical protein
MKKQTAVEWLEQRLNIYLKGKTDETLWKIKKKFDQAKEMEKEQIIEAYKEARNLGCKCYDDLDDTNAEPFYNQTYKDINL